MLPLRGDSLSSFFRERAQHSFFSLQIRGYTRGCVAKYKAFPKFKCRLDRCSGRVRMQSEPCNTARRGRGKSGGSHPGAGGPGLQAHSLRVPCCIHGQAAAPSGIVKTAEAQGEGSLCRTLSLYLDRTAPRRVSSGCVPDPASLPSCSVLCPGSLHPLVLAEGGWRGWGVYCCPTGPRARVVAAEMPLPVPGAASSFLAPSPPTLPPPSPHKFSPLLPKWGICLVLDADRYNLPTDQKCLPVDQKITGSSLPTRGAGKRTGGEGEGQCA